MQNLYIDESGSMTTEYVRQWPYFVIAIVRCENVEKLRKLYSRFVRKHMNELQNADSEKRMFKNGKFSELKGSAFTAELKRSFVSFFARSGTLEVYYVVLNNTKIAEHAKVSNNLYANKARAFNYTLKLALEYYLKKGFLPDDRYLLQLDERNEKTETRHFLQNYLNTELQMSRTLSNDVAVRYFDSANNKIVQIADVFANLYYSQLRTSNYEKEIAAMRTSGCLKGVFNFPL